VDKQIEGGWKMIAKTKESLGVSQFAYWKNI
jgi:hypothetical protein